MDDMTGANWTTLGGVPGTGVNQFYYPAGVFVDGASRIYVADSLNNRLVRFNDMAGTAWTTLGSQGSGDIQFNEPTGIFVDEESRIIVADFGNARVVRINDMIGAGWTTLRTPGPPRGIFVY
jgi:DNA-binding beta-propeller fold protein YncE